MKYQDHKLLEEAYSKIVIKEEFPPNNFDKNFGSGRDSREAFEPEGYKNVENSESEESEIDFFKSALSEIYNLLDGKVPDNVTDRIIELFKNSNNKFFKAGQKAGKNTWK